MNKVKTLFLSIIISLAVAAIAFAWTNPTANPPGGGGALYYSTGNVGIGTTEPGAKLEVNGDIICKATKVRAFRSTSQSLSSETWTKVQFDSESFDVLNEYDNVTNYRFTASKAGYYYVTGTIYLRLYTTGNLAELKLMKNGATDLNIVRNGAVESSGAEFSLAISDIISLSANDYLEWFAWQNSGYDRTIFQSPRTWMAITWVP